MKRVGVASLVLFGLVGVAYADSPGGWSQFDAMVKGGQAQKVVVQAAPVGQPKEVAQFVTNEKTGTWVFPANPNGDNN